MWITVEIGWYLVWHRVSRSFLKQVTIITNIIVWDILLALYSFYVQPSNKFGSVRIASSTWENVRASAATADITFSKTAVHRGSSEGWSCIFHGSQARRKESFTGTSPWHFSGLPNGGEWRANDMACIAEKGWGHKIWCIVEDSVRSSGRQQSSKHAFSVSVNQLHGTANLPIFPTEIPTFEAQNKGLTPFKNSILTNPNQTLVSQVHRNVAEHLPHHQSWDSQSATNGVMSFPLFVHEHRQTKHVIKTIYAHSCILFHL